MKSTLGTGGMGEVYRARDTRLGRDVAVKVLPDSVATDADRLLRFEQEARVLGTLSHPNLLAIYDVGTQGEIHYLVSEYLEGQTLRERLSADPLTQHKVIEYAQQIAKGLAAAHDNGSVHRDLKPENIFVTRDGHVKILDFGLAKQSSGLANLPEGTASLTGPALTAPGTLQYPALLDEQKANLLNSTDVDEGRKRVLLIAASILAARKFSQFDGGKRVPATISAIADAVRWAEEIMKTIDERWPAG